MSYLARIVTAGQMENLDKLLGTLNEVKDEKEESITASFVEALKVEIDTEVDGIKAEKVMKRISAGMRCDPQIVPIGFYRNMVDIHKAVKKSEAVVPENATKAVPETPKEAKAPVEVPKEAKAPVEVPKEAKAPVEAPKEPQAPADAPEKRVEVVDETTPAPVAEKPVEAPQEAPTAPTETQAPAPTPAVDTSGDQVKAMLTMDDLIKQNAEKFKDHTGRIYTPSNLYRGENRKICLAFAECPRTYSEMEAKAAAGEFTKEKLDLLFEPMKLLDKDFMWGLKKVGTRGSEELFRLLPHWYEV